MTVVDTVQKRGELSAFHDYLLSDGPLAFDLTSRVLEAVRQDPFATISQIRRETCRDPQAPVVGWWEVLGVLRRNKLLTRRSRFRYARGRW